MKNENKLDQQHNESVNVFNDAGKKNNPTRQRERQHNTLLNDIDMVYLVTLLSRAMHIPLTFLTDLPSTVTHI